MCVGRQFFLASAKDRRARRVFLSLQRPLQRPRQPSETRRHQFTELDPGPGRESLAPGPGAADGAAGRAAHWSRREPPDPQTLRPRLTPRPLRPSPGTPSSPCTSSSPCTPPPAPFPLHPFLPLHPSRSLPASFPSSAPPASLFPPIEFLPNRLLPPFFSGTQARPHPHPFPCSPRLGVGVGGLSWPH